MKLAFLIVCVAGLGVATTGGASVAPEITQSAIAKANLGQTSSAYKHVLGTPVRRLRGTTVDPGSPEDYSRLVFGKRKLSVYFVDGADKGVLVTTWNKAYRTAAGVGPCSTIKRLKAVYGARLKPSKFNTQHGVVYAYTVGRNLVFASDSQTIVDAVGLYDGSDPNVGQPGGSLSYAGFITLSESACY